VISIRHTGIYVHNLERMENFYKRVFAMIPICSGEFDKSPLFDDLYKHIDVSIETSKLITPYGKHAGQGDMIELVHVISPDECIGDEPSHLYPIYDIGKTHVAFGVDDITEVIKLIIENDGLLQTNVYVMTNGNKCAFATDPEGNWLELIQRKE